MKNAFFKMINGRVTGFIVAGILLSIIAVLFTGYNVLLVVGLTISSVLLICLIFYISPFLVMDFLNYKKAIKKG